MGIIDEDDGGNTGMLQLRQNHRPYFVGVVTPSVWRPIILDL